MYPLRPFKVLFTNHYPSSNFECKGKFPKLKAVKGCAWPGIMNEIIGVIRKHLNLEIVPIIVTTGTRNQFTTAAAFGDPNFPFLEMILNGTIDTAALPFQTTPERMKLFDFAKEIFTVTPHFYVHRIDNLSENWWRMLEVFDPSAWKVIGVLLVLQCILFSGIRYCEFRSFGEKYCLENFVDVFWETFRIQCFQPKNTKYCFLSGRFASCSFGLIQCSILFGTFGSYLLSSAITQTPDLSSTLMPNVLKDLANGKKEIITGYKNNWLVETINTSSSYPYKELKEAMKGKNMNLVEDLEDAIDQIRVDKMILFAMNNEKIALVARMFCDILPVKHDFPRLKTHLILRKNHSLTREISNAIEVNFQEMKNIYKRYNSMVQLTNSICFDQKLGDPLKLTSYIGLLILCCGLWIAGSISFLTEFIFFRRKTFNNILL